MIFDLSQSSCQKTTESATQRCSRVEKTDSIQHLMSSIEHGQIHDHPTQETTFEHTEEESSGNKATKRLCEAEKSRHKTPAKDEKR